MLEAVFQAYLGRAVHRTEHSVQLGDPLSGGLGLLLPPVDAWGSQGEVDEVGGEPRNRLQVSASHKPLSWASERPRMCSMSVSLMPPASRALTFKLSADPFFIEKVRDIVGTLP